MAQLSKSELTYEPDLTGLLIVDPYNDFLSEGGKLYDRSRSTLEANNVVEHMRQVLAADGRSLYVVNYDSDTITKLNASNLHVIQTFPTGAFDSAMGAMVSDTDLTRAHGTSGVTGGSFMPLVIRVSTKPGSTTASRSCSRTTATSGAATTSSSRSR